MVYLTHKFNLTNKQIKKLGSALNDEKAITIKIKKEQYQGEIPLPLTLAELNKIKDGAPEITISLSVKKINHIKNNHEGGFLKLLLLILVGIGAATGVGSLIANGVSGAKTNANEAARNEELKRHNLAMEEESKYASGRSTEGRSGDGLFNTLKLAPAVLAHAALKGSGMRTSESPCRGYGKNTVGATTCPACGSGLLLKAKRGKGLYLRPHSGSGYGDGLIAGIASAAGNNSLPVPDAIANIPFLGSIAKLLW